MSHPAAFLLAPKACKPDLSALIEHLRRRHPDVPVATSFDAEAAHSAEPILFHWSGCQFFLAAIDAPIPNDEEMWWRAASFWDDPKASRDRHNAHLIVSAMGPTDAGKLDVARATTAVIGALIASMPDFCGVVWTGRVARSPELWLDMSRDAFAPYPDHPCLLWVDFFPIRSKQSTVARTIGVSAFIGREIEIDAPGAGDDLLLQKSVELASYLVAHGDIIKDGDRIDILDGEPAKVYRCPSPLDGSPVLRFGSEPGPSLTKRYPIIAASIAKHHPLLVLLERVGLFDAASLHNHVDLAPAAYVSEVRLDSFDEGVRQELTNILASDAYVAGDKKARISLAQGDIESARTALQTFAEDVKQFQATLRFALTRGDLHLFLPRRAPPSQPA
jgi:hypothetical protein